MIERLQKIIAAAGLASRRAAEELITAGRVRINGQVATLGMSADADADEITVDGAPIRAGKSRSYIMLNKPRGYVTTMSDERGRRTVAELVQTAGVRLYPVGRLDMWSEGLLIMTDDGEAANRLMHPSHNVKKTYHAYVTGEDITASVRDLRRPMDIDGYTVRPAEASVLTRDGQNAVLEVKISEGRNRQVRKMCALCGLNVGRLVRVAEGELRLGELQSGKWRRLTTEEIAYIRGIE